MACKACERRRKRLAEKRAKAQAQGKRMQAAAIGAVLAATDAAGKAIHGEVKDDNGTDEHRGSGSSGSERDS